MALSVGDAAANSGMTKAIYDQLDALMSSKIPADSLPDAQEGWKQLAFAVASGVIAHILSNMEVRGLQVSGAASLTVNGDSATGTVTSTQTSVTTNLIR